MDYIERLLAFILQNRRGHDDGLIPRTPPFAHVREPTITLECPDIGPTGSKIPPKYGFFEAGEFPTLKWTFPPTETGAEGQEDGEGRKEVKEWFLAVEDPDAPMSEPVAHGLYYSIPAERRSVSHEDFKKLSSSDSTDYFTLKGGFKYGLNRRKTVYIPPRGLLGHGPHRYFFEIVALSEPIDTEKLSVTGATREELVKKLEGKVIAWGQWVGVWERHIVLYGQLQDRWM
ncbi:conserved hypothetical protein [Talaromyces stipitatus ATCC 10500]|uniref:PEBP-like protein n=1 Tax=Talaromyces stipitatus (strain ATCC 10500 / CBS 375.48 / QM 6759 / NRRL 1006) TaxID=441959 RepID=B8M5F2_TALSN|nr:uncharacterized protein TSTA_030250 [Talaromyces stipitatus ATCC 10500]EED19758.1 conserved hypothetical protein [Talaromyces stipitatus ATCC 10500]